MSNDDQAPKRRRWPYLLGTAVLLAGGGYAISQLVNDDAPTTDPTAVPTTPTLTDPTAPEYVVEAGGGGTTTASVDGVTPMGYPQTCEGAIAAATNQWLAVSAQPEGWWSPEGLARTSELVDYFAPGEIDDITWMSDFKTAREEAAAVVNEHGTYNWADMNDASLGAFHIVSCSSSVAVVDIVYGSLVSTPETSEFTAYGSQRVTVGWLGDWSLREAADIPSAEDPATEVQPERLGGFSPEVRRALIEAGGPGWMEYSNAPE